MSTGINGVTNRDLHNLACAATGAAINRADNAEELKQYLLFGGGLMMAPTAFKAGKAVVWDLPKWGYQNYGNYNNAFKTAWNNSIGQTNLYSANRQALKGNFWSTVQNNSLKTQFGALNVPRFDEAALNAEKRGLERLNQVLKANSNDDILKSSSRAVKRSYNNYKLTRNANNLAKARIYRHVNQLMHEAEGLTGEALSAKMKEIKQAQAKAELLVQRAKSTGAIKSATKLGQAASYVKTKTGVRAVQTAIAKGTLSSNTAVRVLSKGCKAGGGMAIISAAMEAPSVYKTYKELGAAKGTKQLGKSLVKVGAETAGYVVGAKLGGIAGAKLGAAVGTCIGGPIGTAIGGAVGAIVGVAAGILGSWLCGKAARAVVGKDELEKAKEAQTKQLIEAAQDDKGLQAELADAARQQLEAGNVASEKDAQDIVNSYNRVAVSLTGENAESETTASSSSTQNSPVNEPKTKKSENNNNTGYDRGYQALLSLAGKNNNTQTTSYTGFNPFGYQSFNPFPNMNFNPYQSFNPFGFNYFNTLAGANPFMINPYFQYGNYAA